MKKIAPMMFHLKPSNNKGIFHDSRGDIRQLAKLVNDIIEKQNEVIATVNKLIESNSKDNDK